MRGFSGWGAPRLQFDYILWSMKCKSAPLQINLFKGQNTFHFLARSFSFGGNRIKVEREPAMQLLRYTGKVFSNTLWYTDCSLRLWQVDYFKEHWWGWGNKWNRRQPWWRRSGMRRPEIPWNMQWLWGLEPDRLSTGKVNPGSRPHIVNWWHLDCLLRDRGRHVARGKPVRSAFCRVSSSYRERLELE